MIAKFVAPFIILALTTPAFARESTAAPKDPYASMKAGEHISAFDHGRAGHYIEQIARHAIAEKKTFEEQMQILHRVTKEMVEHYDPLEHMSVLSILNSVLFELSVQYRHHTAVDETSEFFDMKGHADGRRDAVLTAGAIAGAIASLPAEIYEIDPMFDGQRSKSTPLMVLHSYLPNKEAGHKPFFNNELYWMLQVQIRVAQSKTGLIERMGYKFKNLLGIQPKSCSAFTSVKTLTASEL